MKLAQSSRRRIENFFRAHFDNSKLILPPIEIHFGFWANLITRTFKISGITLGRHVFIAPEFVRRDSTGELIVDVDLIVHEITHVWQYRQLGFVGFLYSYLKAWFGFLRAQGRDVETRWQAYYAIPHEEEARAAATAYAEWRLQIKNAK